MRRATTRLARTASKTLRASYQTSAPENLTQSRHGNLPGSSQSPITTQLHFFNSVLEETRIPTFRVLDSGGKIIEGAHIPE
ncbi:hypothetical protein FS837_005830, partial [Tulasnella sp. UAMH 9824]